MNNLMIDLETAGTAVNCPVLSVGACYFDPMSGAIGDTFYEAVSFESAFLNGKASGATMKWWMQQSDDARKTVISGTMRSADVLSHFRAFCVKGGPQLTVWGNGSSFDISILEYQYQKIEDRDAPWKFWNVRDCRTIKDLAPAGFIMPVRKGTYHQALDDAIYQATWVSDIYRQLKGKPKLLTNEDPFTDL